LTVVAVLPEETAVGLGMLGGAAFGLGDEMGWGIGLLAGVTSKMGLPDVALGVAEGATVGVLRSCSRPFSSRPTWPGAGVLGTGLFTVVGEWVGVGEGFETGNATCGVHVPANVTP